MGYLRTMASVMAKKDLTKSQERVRNNGEVFTPNDFAKVIFAKWMRVSHRKPQDVFVDLQCGQGSLLGTVLEWKLENGLSPQEALSTILGVDIAHDNVEDCRHNLLVWAAVEDDEICKEIVQENIIQGDSVKKSLHELFPQRSDT